VQQPNNITHIVIHYSATYSDQDFRAADIDKMHRQRGFKKIGYHYVICRDGKVEKGRPDTEIGAHVGGQNTNKIGVCWIGGLERKSGANTPVDNRTSEQIKAMINLLAELTKKYPKAQVVGHRDLAATHCPGFNIKAWYQTVQAAKAAVTPTKH
jgi:N-acetylmuramoyl-L-alanine amidase